MNDRPTPSFMQDRADRLRNQIWWTQQARLVASNRCRRNEAWSTATLTFVSLYVVLASIAGLVVDLEPGTGCALSYTSVASSLIILVVSLYDINQSYGVKHERFLRCGRDLGRIVRKLDVIVEVQAGAIDDLILLHEEYGDVLDTYSENHYSIDFYRAQWINKSENQPDDDEETRDRRTDQRGRKWSICSWSIWDIDFWKLRLLNLAWITLGPLKYILLLSAPAIVFALFYFYGSDACSIPNSTALSAVRPML